MSGFCLLKISFVLNNKEELIPRFNPLKRDGNNNNYLYILPTMALHVESQCLIAVEEKFKEYCLELKKKS